jgi:hypothetical protein
MACGIFFFSKSTSLMLHSLLVSSMLTVIVAVLSVSLKRLVSWVRVRPSVSRKDVQTKIRAKMQKGAIMKMGPAKQPIYKDEMLC